MKFEFYPETHCDYCGEVIHCHFDCPMCNKNYAGTDLYGDSLFELRVGETFSCELCGAEFKKVSGSNEWNNNEDSEFEKVEEA